jgi:two-component system phosphate regulon sensor histidine kinase PhoR
MIKDAKILIVDDEKPIRVACAKILSEEGAWTQMAANGLEGWEKARGGSFDLTLVDLKMPQMDGMELLVRLNEFDPDMVKIVITGYATLETAVQAVQKGAYDYIAKPFTPSELRNRVNHGLEKRALLLEAKRFREERERNLLELANEKSRTRTIMQCMGDGLLVTNRDRQLVFWNPAGGRLLKVKRPIQVGEPLANITHDPEFIGLIENVMRIKETSVMVSKELSSPAPGDPVLMANCAPVRDEKGEVIGTVTVLRDITELKELDKAKSNFVSMVAHELRAPLAAIEGYLDVILEGIGRDDPEKIQKILNRSRERTHALLALINDLLTLSRMESGRVAKEKEKVAIGELLDEVGELLRGRAMERQVALRLELSEGLPEIWASREDLIRVFTNLLDNAIKYNRTGGEIRVRAEKDEAFIRISVQDTGIGIPPKDLEHVFDEFYRVKIPETRTITGTGLGLSIAKRIVEAHDGHIEVQSQVQQGSTFRVLLPIA